MHVYIYAQTYVCGCERGLIEQQCGTFTVSVIKSIQQSAGNVVPMASSLNAMCPARVCRTDRAGQH